MTTPTEPIPRVQSAELANEVHAKIGVLSGINVTLWDQLEAVARLAGERKQRIDVLERDVAQLRTELNEAREQLASSNGHGDVDTVVDIEAPAGET